ncbi:hypothetical protein OKW29_004234 [Paraburkholderia sp. CI3]
MPPASSLIDGSGNTWTMTGGSVYKNGAIAGNNYNVTVAMCYNGNIYVENTSAQWFQWTGTAWMALPGSARGHDVPGRHHDAVGIEHH